MDAKHFQNSYVEILTLNAVVSEGGEFGRYLSQEGSDSKYGITGLVKRTTQHSWTAFLPQSPKEEKEDHQQIPIC